MRILKLYVITTLFVISAPFAIASPKFIQTSPVINDTNCICSDTECHRDYKRAVTIDSWNVVDETPETLYSTISPGASGYAAVNADGYGNVLTLAAHGSPYLTNDPYCGLYIYTATVGDYRNYCSADYPCYPTSSNDPCQSSKFKKAK